MQTVFKKTPILTDTVLHYCPGCTHGIVHRLVAQAIEELSIEGKTIGVVEAKKDDAGENITVVEGQSGRYANSKFKYVNVDYHIRFACLID